MQDPNGIESTFLHADIHNLFDNFRHGLQRAGRNGPYLGSRGDYGKPYKFTSYGDTLFTVNNLVGALQGQKYKPGKNIGIFAKSRAEWILVDLACAAGNYVSVPLYDSFSKEDLRYIMQQTKLDILFMTSNNLPLAIELWTDENHPLPMQLVVVMDDVADYVRNLYNNDSHTCIMSMTAFVKDGLSKRLLDEYISDAEREGERLRAKKNDVATICYTSGTTGTPKGVVLTHGNILAELDALELLGNNGKLFLPTQNDVHMSYLPLAHIFERIMVHYLTRMGGSIGFYLGVVQRLSDDLKALRPTVFVSVPRLLNRIFEKTIESVQVKGGISAFLFNHSLKKRERNLRAGRLPKDGWLEKHVFSNLRNQLGGRVRVIVCGSAPLPAKVINFFRTTFNAHVYEGYGQTETSAGITLTHMNETQAGHVGYPLPGFEIKIDPVTDSSGENTNNEGEILVRGDGVFRGYYKAPEKTAEAFTDDGWYRTGDLGYWDGQGRLVVKDRVKSLFKLSQGEYVSPEKLEKIYCEQCDAISDIFVTGDSAENFTVAIVVPEPGFSANAGKEKKIECELLRIGKKMGLHGFEIPKRVFLVDAFPDDLLTPTFKLKRNMAKKRYEKEIWNLYQQERQAK